MVQGSLGLGVLSPGTDNRCETSASRVGSELAGEVNQGVGCPRPHGARCLVGAECRSWWSAMEQPRAALPLVEGWLAAVQQAGAGFCLGVLACWGGAREWHQAGASMLLVPGLAGGFQDSLSHTRASLCALWGPWGPWLPSGHPS